MTGDRTPSIWLIAIGAALVGAFVLLTPLNERLSRPAFDWQLRLLAPSTPPDGVVVVDIDDASLAALKTNFGPWPFKRDAYALAIEHLRDLGARAIAFDLVFADSYPGDEALARTLARAGAPVVLAAAGLRHASDDPGESGARISPDRGRTSEAVAAPAHRWPTIALPARSVWPAGGGLPSIGVITTPVDDDGVLRRLPLWHEANGRRWPLTALAVLEQLEGTDARSIVVDRSGAVHVAFASPASAPPVMAFADLMEHPGGGAATVPLRSRVNGRVVFLGSSALLADAVMTVNGQSSGTSVLAQTYVALRDRTWVHPTAPWANGLLVALTLLPALWAGLRGRLSPKHDVGAAVLTVLAAIALAGYWLVGQRLPTLWAAPLVTAAAGLALAVILNYRAQFAAQQRLAYDLAVATRTSRAKGEFVAYVSHEIRTPLNALLGAAELLAGDELTPTQRRHVQLFQDAGRTLHRLVDDLLDLSKIEAGRFDVERAPFSLRRSLQRVIDLMQSRASSKGVRLVLEVADGLPDGVLGDGRRLEQALSNLVGNAVKFTQRGDVTVRAAPDPTLADGVVIEVADTGIGIDPRDLEMIFEPFSQARGTAPGPYGGTGLGLAITRRAAELMGGSIRVRSTPGSGSVFSLRLPLPRTPLEADAPVAVASRRTPDGRPLHVLLAEDDEINAYVFRAFLENEPLTIESAADGVQALESLRRRRYDLAFIDVQMPRLDGLSVTRELRKFEAQTGRPRTPVVALTGNALASDIDASLAAGCDRHLAKPFAKAHLLEAIRDLGESETNPRTPG